MEKNLKNGKNTGWINWALAREDCYILPHGKEFKEWEEYWLDKLGNMKPIGYRRAYYTYLQTAAGRKIKTR